MSDENAEEPRVRAGQKWKDLDPRLKKERVLEVVETDVLQTTCKDTTTGRITKIATCRLAETAGGRGYRLLP